MSDILTRFLLFASSTKFFTLSTYSEILINIENPRKGCVCEYVNIEAAPCGLRGFEYILTVY